MENVTYKLEFTDDELRCILSGLNTFIKNLNFYGQVNEVNVKSFKKAFDVSSSLYIKLSSYFELINEDFK